jgi:hypothetical protein
MQLWVAGVWGFLGAFAIELVELREAIKVANGFPWQESGRPKRAPYLVSAAIRLILGTIVATAFADSHQISGAAGAILAGVAAPKILQKILMQSSGLPDVKPVLAQPAGESVVSPVPEPSEASGVADVQ